MVRDFLKGDENMYTYHNWGNFWMSNFWLTTNRTFWTVLISNFRHFHYEGNYRTFSIESMIRGYHIYQQVWEASIGEELTCQKERGNLVNPFNHTRNFWIGFSFVWLFPRIQYDTWELCRYNMHLWNLTGLFQTCRNEHSHAVKNNPHFKLLLL